MCVCVCVCVCMGELAWICDICGEGDGVNSTPDMFLCLLQEGERRCPWRRPDSSSYASMPSIARPADW